jgi:hypothetical protein
VYLVYLAIYFLAPLAVSTYLAVAFRCGGGARLWRDAAILVVALTGFTLWQPDIEFYNAGSLGGEGIMTWPFFPAPPW